MSYVFYDTETTGFDRRFDQITQFAAVYTDENFTPKDQINLKCQIRPEIIPSIEALINTNRTIGQLTDKSLPTNYEMLAAVRAKLESWVPACFVGWNTIHFDEEFLRSGFYQNLMPTYLTSMPRNSRLDFLKLAHAVDVLEPDSIIIPRKENGKRTFSLSALAEANGYTNHNAHDALSDVYATIYIAKILKENSRLAWSLGNRFSNKKALMEFLDENEPAIAIEPDYENTRHYPFIKIGNDPQIKPYVHVANLHQEFSCFESMNDIEKTNWIESASKLVRQIRCNSSPIIVPLEEVDQFKDYDIDALFEAAEKLKGNEQLKASLSDVFYIANYRQYENKFIEEQIYDAGFKEDLEVKQKFHQTSMDNWVSLLNQFQHPRSRKFALRLIGEHARETLTAAQISSLNKFIEARMHGLSNEDVPWRTIEKASQELEKISEKPSSNNNQSVKEYRQFLDGIQNTLIGALHSTDA